MNNNTMTKQHTPLTELDDEQWLHSEYIARDLGITTKTLRNRILAGKFPEGEHEGENPHGRLRWRVRVYRAWRAARASLGSIKQ